MNKCKVEIQGEEFVCEIVQENSKTAWVELPEGKLSHRKRIRRTGSINRAAQSIAPSFTGGINPDVMDSVMDTIGKSPRIPHNQEIPDKQTIKIHKKKNKYRKLEKEV